MQKKKSQENCSTGGLKKMINEFQREVKNSCCICKKEIGNHYFCLSDRDNNNKYCEDCIGNLTFGKKVNHIRIIDVKNKANKNENENDFR